MVTRWFTWRLHAGYTLATRWLRGDLEERQVGIEQEARLARAADGEIEILQPIVTQQVLADDLRVVVERVGQQEDLRLRGGYAAVTRRFTRRLRGGFAVSW